MNADYMVVARPTNHPYPRVSAYIGVYLRFCFPVPSVVN